jgi:hypothetical protein
MKANPNVYNQYVVCCPCCGSRFPNISNRGKDGIDVERFRSGEKILADSRECERCKTQFVVRIEFKKNIESRSYDTPFIQYDFSPGKGMDVIRYCPICTDKLADAVSFEAITTQGVLMVECIQCTTHIYCKKASSLPIQKGYSHEWEAIPMTGDTYTTHASGHQLFSGRNIETGGYQQKDYVYRKLQPINVRYPESLKHIPTQSDESLDIKRLG